MRGFQQGNEVSDGGTAGKGHTIRNLGWILEAGLDGLDGPGRDHVAIDGDGGDLGSGLHELLLNDVSGVLSGGDKEAGWGAVGLEGVGSEDGSEGFGDGLRRDKGWFCTE